MIKSAHKVLHRSELYALFDEYPDNSKDIVKIIKNNNFIFDMTSSEFFSFYDQVCNNCPKFDQYCTNRLQQIYHFDPVEDKMRMIQVMEWSDNNHFIYPYLRILSYYGPDYIDQVKPSLISEISIRYCDMILYKE